MWYASFPVKLTSNMILLVMRYVLDGNADALVTFNRRDFGNASGDFGIALLSPREALRRIPS